MNSAFENEMKWLEDDYANGDISDDEYNQQYEDLMESYQAEAEDAAQQAYDDEYRNW